MTPGSQKSWAESSQRCRRKQKRGTMSRQVKEPPVVWPSWEDSGPGLAAHPPWGPITAITVERPASVAECPGTDISARLHQALVELPPGGAGSRCPHRASPWSPQSTEDALVYQACLRSRLLPRRAGVGGRESRSLGNRLRNCQVSPLLEAFHELEPWLCLECPTVAALCARLPAFPAPHSLPHSPATRSVCQTHFYIPRP